MLPKRKEFKWTLNDKRIIDHIDNDRYKIWESRNGTQTCLKDMDHNHIKNCEKMILRGGDGREQCLIYLQTELIYRELLIRQSNENKNGNREQRR